MRAKEFITERRFAARKERPMVYTKTFPSMPSSNPYDIYRFGMAMADHTIAYADGPVANYAIVSAYTPEEEDIIKGGEKQTGDRGVEVADRGSKEPKSTGVQSPVSKPRRNRYGV